ncbi:MAG: toll/interleukin-1 receptor domain-containing protein [Elusimicrobiota bacterium]
MQQQDHIFISYAEEDWSLAEWLTLKLTIAGYSVWCDHFKLLGGESFPVEIDDAIKNRTFRLVALLSRNSISKPNPLKERTLAIKISKDRKIDFLIPINVDGLKATELDWMTTDLTYIPFNKSWADGLNQLLRKLQSLEAPRPLLKAGMEAAIEAYLPKSAINQTPENLYLNCLPIEQIPKIIKHFELNRQLSWEEMRAAEMKWAFHTDARIRRKVLSFQVPPSDLIQNVEIKPCGETAWETVKTVDGIDSSNLAVILLNKCIKMKMYEKGLQIVDKMQFYFPKGLLDGNWLKFVSYDGKNRRLQVTGERSSWVGKDKQQKYNYHFSPELWVRRDLVDNYVVQVNVRLFIVDSLGNAFKQRSAASRRKKVSRGWKNKQWLMRHIGICSFLSDGNGKIEIGKTNEEKVVIYSNLFKVGAPYGINEITLRKGASESSDIGESDISGDDILIDGVVENE